MQQKRQIKNRQAYEQSIREFAQLLYSHPDIMGGTDIDFLYERKGKFLMIEGKKMQSGTIFIKYGQYKAMMQLAKVCPNMTCYLAAETPLGFYLCPIQHAKLGMYDEREQGYHIETIEWKYYPTKAFVEFVASICRSFNRT